MNGPAIWPVTIEKCPCTVAVLLDFSLLLNSVQELQEECNVISWVKYALYASVLIGYYLCFTLRFRNANLLYKLGLHYAAAKHI